MTAKATRGVLLCYRIVLLTNPASQPASQPAMADEARAMLDALMGSDRNASLPVQQDGDGDGSDPHGLGHRHSNSHHPPGPSSHRSRKRSCYDPAVCPLYCAWGTDLHELFTNTKSDIGPNPRTCDDDAREEYLALPPGERERLGFDGLLYERLRDLVRGCDRTVNRNRDKLRQEVARQQRARAGGGGGGAAGGTTGGGSGGGSSNVNVDDPAANISEDKVRKVAEDRARLELIEEDVGRMIRELEGLDEEEEGIVAGAIPKKVAGASDAAAADEGSTEAKAQTDAKADTTSTSGGATEEEAANTSTTKAQSDAKEEKKDDGPATPEEKADGETGEETTAEISSKETKDGEEGRPTTKPATASLDGATKAKLAEIRSRKRSVLTALSSKMDQIPPLRDAIESDTRHLHYFRSNHTIDKCVCEVSGNFMSFRDADERIAAHYAGKQYVGWKMVRDKLDELKKKFGSGGPPPPSRGPPPGYRDDHRRGGGGGGGGGYRDDHRRGGGGGGGRRRDRSRSRERNRDRHRGGGGGRRRSPDRWERDRAPRDWDRSRGGGRRDRW